MALDLRKNKAYTWAECNPVAAITIDLTKRCNLRCKYCFTNINEDNYCESDISEENAYKIVDWVLRPDVRGTNRNIDLTFWGGEPMLKFDLMKKIVDYANKKGKLAGVTFTYGMTTNVTLLTPEKFDWVLEHDLSFMLSIDGTKEHHDKNRVTAGGKGSWDLVDKNATEILKVWKDASARISYTAEGIHEFMDDMHYFINKGFKYIAYSPVVEGDWTQDRLAILRDVWYEIADLYIKHHNEGNLVSFKGIDDALRAWANKHNARNQAPCGAGQGYLCITTDLAIYPCHRFNKFDDTRPWYEKDYCLGHVDHDCVNKDFKDKFDHWDIFSDCKNDCEGCPARGTMCHGGCWATNHDNNGDIAILSELDCFVSTLNMDIGEYLVEQLGEDTVRKIMGMGDGCGCGLGENYLPLVQGCECYNTQDHIFGRLVTDNDSPYRCVCNMAAYGTEPKAPKTCTCYNVEDVKVSYFDQTGMSCSRFTGEKEKEHECACGGSCGGKNPLDKAMSYLQELDNENLSDDEKQKLGEFKKAFIRGIMINDDIEI